MENQEIKKALLEGHQFENERWSWYTVINPSKNTFCICYNHKEYRYYKNIDSVARRISQLIKKQKGGSRKPSNRVGI